ncbi:hypothetical protein LEMLEM_LOCUS14764 [Lemmus lemmus]
MSVTLPGTPPCSRKPKAPLPEKKGDSLFINSAGGKPSLYLAFIRAWAAPLLWERLEGAEAVSRRCDVAKD